MNYRGFCFISTTIEIDFALETIFLYRTKSPLSANKIMTQVNPRPILTIKVSSPTFHVVNESMSIDSATTPQRKQGSRIRPYLALVHYHPHRSSPPPPSLLHHPPIPTSQHPLPPTPAQKPTQISFTAVAPHHIILPPSQTNSKLTPHNPQSPPTSPRVQTISTTPPSSSTPTTPDDDFDVCIDGGGPGGLATLSATIEPYSRDKTNDEKNTVKSAYDSGLATRRKPPRVCVVDPGDAWLQTWHERFKALQIKWLRSPMGAHPDAFDINSMLAYATTEGRAKDMFDSGVDKKKFRTVREAHSGILNLPSNALFEDFCKGTTTRRQQGVATSYIISPH